VATRPHIIITARKLTISFALSEIFIFLLKTSGIGLKFRKS